MKKLLLIAAFLGISTVSAFAACTSPAVMHDFPGTAFNMSLGTNSADGNCISINAIASWGGVQLGAATAYGTAPTGIVPGVNAFVTNPVAVTGTFWQTTQPVSGTFWQTTQPISVASGAIVANAYASGSIGSGAMVDLGAIADAAATAGSTGTLSAKARLMTTQLGAINTTLGTPMQNSGGSVTANLGTIGTAATAANQTTGNTSAAATATALGTPTDAPCTLPATATACSDTAIQKATANALNSPGAIAQTTQGTTNGVTNGANNTNTIAASATAQILSATSGGTTGATGDYLSHCVIQPATTSPGAVTIADNSTTIFSFAGGASSVSNLVPFAIPAGAVSKSGGWKVTTGTNVSLACVGKFS